MNNKLLLSFVMMSVSGFVFGSDFRDFAFDCYFDVTDSRNMSSFYYKKSPVNSEVGSSVEASPEAQLKKMVVGSQELDAVVTAKKLGNGDNIKGILKKQIQFPSRVNSYYQ